MTTSCQHVRRLLPIALGVFIACIVLVQPAMAHAINFLWNPVGATLEVILGILTAFNQLLGSLLSAVGNGLKLVLSWQITELTVVEAAWTIIRNMCNLVFIVIFIGIAFGTIFNATGWIPAGWHYRTALMPLLIAALLMNFSLAIGKTIVLGSNAAMNVVLGIVKDPGNMLVAQLQPNNLAVGIITDPAIKAALNSDLSAVYAALSDVENKRMQECLKEKTKLPSFFSDEGFGGKGFSVFWNRDRKGYGECLLEINDARHGTTSTKVAIAAQIAASPPVPTGTTQQVLMFIADSIFKSFMILIFISCLLSAAMFLGLRIIMVWVLLATSALAWVSYAIPGNKEGWRTWWKHMIAWNVFGPLYLLTLIPGLVMLGGSAEVLLRLQATGANIGLANAIAQQLLFYVFSAIIFVGGLALSLKSSFGGAVAGTQVVGGWATKLGVFDKKGLAPLREAGRRTGVIPAYEGTRARVTEKYQEKIVKPQQRWEEAVKARFQGGMAQETLQRKRIEEAAKGNKESGKSILDLQADLKKSGPAYYAAASQLLEAGELSPTEMEGYVTKAKTINPAYGQVVQEQVNKKILDRAKNKKVKNSAESLATLNMYAPNPKDAPELTAAKTKMRDDFLKSIEKNQPLVAADMGAAFYPGKTPEQIVKANFGSLENKDILQLVDHLENGTMIRDQDFEKLIAGKGRKLDSYLNLMTNASPTQQVAINGYMTTHGIRARP